MALHYSQVIFLFHSLNILQQLGPIPICRSLCSDLPLYKSFPPRIKLLEPMISSPHDTEVGKLHIIVIPTLGPQNLLQKVRPEIPLTEITPILPSLAHT